MALIIWIDLPEKALSYIINLYKEFHALKFSIKCLVEGFNSAFNELPNRLIVLRVIINFKNVFN